jgi:hypothetical protein
MSAITLPRVVDFCTKVLGQPPEQPELIAEVAKILADRDLVDLIRVGAPRDEYLGEAIEIVTWLCGTEQLDPIDNTVSAVAQAVHRVFTQQFGASVFTTTTDEIVGTAEQILALWRQQPKETS